MGFGKDKGCNAHEALDKLEARFNKFDSYVAMCLKDIAERVSNIEKNSSITEQKLDERISKDISTVIVSALEFKEEQNIKISSMMSECKSLIEKSEENIISQVAEVQTNLEVVQASYMNEVKTVQENFEKKSTENNIFIKTSIEDLKLKFDQTVVDVRAVEENVKGLEEHKHETNKKLETVVGDLYDFKNVDWKMMQRSLNSYDQKLEILENDSKLKELQETVLKKNEDIEKSLRHIESSSNTLSNAFALVKEDLVNMKDNFSFMSNIGGKLEKLDANFETVNADLTEFINVDWKIFKRKNNSYEAKLETLEKDAVFWGTRKSLIEKDAERRIEDISKRITKLETRKPTRREIEAKFSRLVDDISMLKDSIEYFYCKYCEKKLDSAYSLKTHLKSKHNKQPTEE